MRNPALPTGDLFFQTNDLLGIGLRRHALNIAPFPLETSAYAGTGIFTLNKYEMVLWPARGGRTAAILAGFTSTCRRHNIDPQPYFTQLLTNLPAASVRDLAAWLPDRWKLAQEARLASLQNQAPLP